MRALLKIHFPDFRIVPSFASSPRAPYLSTELLVFKLEHRDVIHRARANVDVESRAGIRRRVVSIERSHTKTFREMPPTSHILTSRDSWKDTQKPEVQPRGERVRASDDDDARATTTTTTRAGRTETKPADGAFARSCARRSGACEGARSGRR